MNYYNEIDPFCANWLYNLIRQKLIPPGDIDTRDIRDVKPTDLNNYKQCHFFAGIGGWPLSLALAGVAPDEPIWTGSCPCQPFSAAGRRGGFSDERHLWPSFHYLIAQCRPPTIYGEQVASAADWLRLVRGDLEALEYAVGAIPIEAASAGADHLRDRFWFVAHDDGRGLGRPSICEEQSGRTETFGASEIGWTGAVAHTALVTERESSDEVDTFAVGREARFESGGDSIEWVIGADGKARRVKSGIRLLVNGLPHRVGLLRGFGNAIDPRPAAAFIKASRK